MKRIVATMLILALVVSLAACAGKPLEAAKPLVHDNPVEEYAALIKAGNTNGISVLVKDLAAAGDYTSLAYIVSEEAASSRLLMDFTELYTMFAGKEDMLDLDVWTTYYLAYSKGRNSEWEQELKMISSYHSVVRQYYKDDWQVLKYVFENADRSYSDNEGAQFEQCGSAPNGKALIYFSYGQNGYWKLGASAALPDEYIPASLDEVEYIILMEETNTPDGSYANGATAYRCDYVVSLIHCPDGQVLGKSYPIEGERPPQVINENQPGGTGDPPSPEKIATEICLALSWITRSE